MRQFATRLRNKIRDSGYGNVSDNQIRDEILSKCQSEYIRRKLLEEGPNLTLDHVLNIAKQCEGIEAQMAALSVSTGAISKGKD